MKVERTLLVLASRSASDAARQQLEHAGFPADQAWNADDALALARSNPPALVLVADQLVDGRGDALIQRLRADPALADSFLVLQRAPAGTEVGQAELLADARVRGFDDLACLDELVASWLRQRRGQLALKALRAGSCANTQHEPPLALEQQYESLFSQNPDAVFALDLHGRFLSVNDAFIRMSGYSEHEMLASGIYPLISEATIEVTRANFIRAAAGEAATYEIECMAKDGHQFQAMVTSVPIVVNGETVGIYGLVKDQTQRKEAEKQLQLARERLRLASSLARLGSWEMDVSRNLLSWSDELCALFGLPPGTRPEKADGTRHYAPAHRRRARALFNACLKHGTPYDEELQIIAAEGRPVWVRSIGQAVRDDNGAVVRVQGVLQDITDRKLADSEVQHLGRQLTTTLESMTDAFMTLDPQGRFSYLNAEAERILQTTREQVLGKQIWNEFALVRGSNFEHQFHTALAEHRTVALEEFYAPLGIWLDIRFYPTPAGLAVYFRDISDDKRTARELARSHRALDMLNSCNEALLRVSNEEELLEQICRIAVERGDYKGAWVGFAWDDAARSISIDAVAGDARLAGYVDSLQLSWDESSPMGRGPGGRTIRSGQPSSIVVDDDDASFDPWREAARACGISAGIFLPLRHKGRTFGLMTIYSNHDGAMPEAESSLLQKLADDLAFGIQYLRAQAEQARVQAVISKVAAGVTARSGGEFFQHLAQCVAEALGAQASFVARFLPGAPRSARTLAASIGGQTVPNFTCALDDHLTAALLDSEGAVVIGSWGQDASCGDLNLDFVPRGYAGRRLDNAAGEPIGFLLVLYREPERHSEFIISTLDIFAARAVAEMEHEENDARIRAQAALLDKAQDAIIVLGVDDRVEFWNKSAERLFGWTAAEARNDSLSGLLCDDRTLARFHHAVACTQQHGEWHGELVQRRKDGSQLLVEARWTLVSHLDGQPSSILSINTDISARKAAEQKIEQLAFYDSLTGLPNRQLLLDRLKQSLMLHTRNGSCGALLFIDMDNFKALNDTRGHAMGDQLLAEVARRLTRCVRNSDTVARLGGDEFVVMLEGLDGNLARAAIQAKAIGHSILATLSRNYELDGVAHHSSASIGVTLFNDTSDSCDDLLKHADMAMYQAKGMGRNTLCFFNPQMQTAVNDRVRMEGELREALKRQQFQLFYQAQVDADGQPTGVEALLRWNHPKRGLIFPLEFIALAEDAWLILPLGEWVLETACKQLATWSRCSATAALDISVNVSARQFRHPNFVHQVTDIVKRSGADPKRLTLELTESLLLSDVDDVIAKMTALKKYGVCFSLDDFGTGYSSLAYLKRLPLDQLKIDRAFVSDLLVDSNDAAIVHSIIALGQSLGLQVIAEGVETEGQRDFLYQHHCHAYQGYLFCRPLPIDQLETWLTHRTLVT